MATKCSATIYLTNNTGGNAFIQMSHRNAGSAPEIGSWQAASGETVGPLIVNYLTDTDSDSDDYWYCTASVQDGASPGIYTTGGMLLKPSKECTLGSSNNGGTYTNTIDTGAFDVLPGNGGSGFNVVKLAEYAEVTNVFVFMLENHSFDHLLGFSGLDGVEGLTGTESNSYDHTTFTVKKGAVDPMPIGPGHEFEDTLTQLCGQGTKNPFPKGSYPTINNSGFVASYVKAGETSTKDAGDVMDCCYSEKQVPVLWNLAKDFAVCDNWFSSMPGPTWPNRLFAMGGSSAGLDDSPTTTEEVDWEIVDGFRYQNGSIFQQMRGSQVTYRLYNDLNDQFAKDPDDVFGGYSIVGGLVGVSSDDVHDFAEFFDDINASYPFAYTWIEPNYGDAAGDFHGGSSQHPVDTLRAGEVMLANLYNAIRTSPYWATSMLIVTYDEHGGFYDHVAPPPAVIPGDNYGKGLNTNGFNFSQYGVRVPAVIVSPKIPAGTVSHTLYDHTSILKTVETLFDVPSLTDRDAGANDFINLLSLDQPRADAYPPFGKIGKWIQTDSETMSLAAVPGIDPELDASPLPERGNVHGFLRVAAKTDFELSDGSPATKAAIKAKVQSIQTKGEARAYIRSVFDRVKAIKAAQKAKPAAG